MSITMTADVPIFSEYWARKNIVAISNWQIYQYYIYSVKIMKNINISKKYTFLNNNNNIIKIRTDIHYKKKEYSPNKSEEWRHI